MNYEKVLQAHGITRAHLDKVADTFRARAQDADAALAHPLAVYHTAAVDLALGAVDMHQEVQAGMERSHSARDWFSIFTAVSLSDDAGS